MIASVNTEYGTPEVLQIKEIEKPIPGDNEILIKIHATTVNRTDCGFRKPEYFIVRIFSGFFKPRKKILGNELAGEVEAIGRNVRSFKIGDQVFGLSTYKFGTHAEYISMAETASVTTKPNNMSYAEATAVCDGLMLGMNLVRKIDFKNNPKILINGASGSIGTACVQLAKHYGAVVTAVCKENNFKLIKSLGADKLIDYTKEDFTQRNEKYDYIIDAVGKSSFFKCKNILQPKGVYFSAELGYLSQNVFLALFSPFMPGRKVKFPIPTDNKRDIIKFKDLIEKGNYKAVIDRTYRLDQIIEATKYVETGEKTGNVVISMIAD